MNWSRLADVMTASPYNEIAISFDAAPATGGAAPIAYTR